MFRDRPLRLVMFCTVVWWVQLLLAIAAVRLSWLERTEYLLVLEEALLLTVLLRAGVIWPEFARAMRWKLRRSPRPSPELLAERRRIAHDLHDGLGAQLVSTMAMLDAQNPRELRTLQELEQCMLSMRLVVDGMDLQTEPLLDRLAGLRHRFQPAFERCGVRLVWNVDEGDGADPPVGQMAAEVFFILQEALSNVLQHAQATQVSVTVAFVPEKGLWRFEVCDNGIGLRAGQGAGDGMGLQSMRDRALRAGLRLSCGTLGTGETRICVETPVGEHAWERDPWNGPGGQGSEVVPQPASAGPSHRWGHTPTLQEKKCQKIKLIKGRSLC